jgi:hypothetical protein
MIGNESLVASLDDDAAGELFSWGETAARRMVAETGGLDDVAAEAYLAPRLLALRSMMRALARWAGEAQSLDDESRQALWDRAGEQARVLFGDAFALPPTEDVAQLTAEADAYQVVRQLVILIDELGAKR